MNQLELMKAHCDALYVHNEKLDLICINDWLRRPAPSFWIGFTQEGIQWRFREDISAAVRTRIEALINREPRDNSSRLPHHHASYLALLGERNAIAGPTYWLPALSPGSDQDHRVERVSECNAGVLHDSELEAWIPDVPYQQPMFASLESNRAVSVCASVRSTSVAHEAGVETLPGYRREGHAAAVVACWAQELLRTSIVPLYSTSWHNVASQGVARHLGFVAFGWEYRVG